MPLLLFGASGMYCAPGAAVCLQQPAAHLAVHSCRVRVAVASWWFCRLLKVVQLALVLVLYATAARVNAGSCSQGMCHKQVNFTALNKGEGQLKCCKVACRCFQQY